MLLVRMLSGTCASRDSACTCAMSRQVCKHGLAGCIACSIACCNMMCTSFLIASQTVVPVVRIGSCASQQESDRIGDRSRDCTECQDAMLGRPLATEAQVGLLVQAC